MTTRPAHACPACEYQRGTPGRPHVNSGGITCLDCGNSWKEFGNAEAPHQRGLKVVTQADENAAVDGRVFKFQRLSAKSHGNETPPHPRKPNKSRTGGIALAAAMVIGGLVLSAIVRHSLSGPKSGAFPLQIGAINLQEQRNSQGGRVLTVSGQLTNLSGAGQKIPRISIVLRQSDGYEVFRWFHQSPMVVLPAGDDIGFASSVQLDNPGIVSVEANFDRF